MICNKTSNCVFKLYSSPLQKQFGKILKLFPTDIEKHGTEGKLVFINKKSKFYNVFSENV